MASEAQPDLLLVIWSCGKGLDVLGVQRDKSWADDLADNSGTKKPRQKHEVQRQTSLSGQGPTCGFASWQSCTVHLSQEWRICVSLIIHAFKFYQLICHA